LDIQFLVDGSIARCERAQVPMTSQVILEQAAILDVIDQLRVAIPRGASGAAHQSRERSRALEGPRGSRTDHRRVQEQAALLLQDQRSFGRPS